MKVTSLRLGNIISLIYDPSRYGVVAAMDMSGSVHLSNKEDPDDIRDVMGIEITEKLLAKLGRQTAIYINGREIIISLSDKNVSVTIDGVMSYRLKFLHELQNLFYFYTGQELIDPDEFLHC